jgi:nitroreductase
MSEQVFEAVIVRPERKGGLTYINLPFNAAKIFNSKGRIKVEGTINEFPYRSSLIPKGNGAYILPLDKQLQKSINIDDDKPLQIIMRPLSNKETEYIPNDYELLDSANIDLIAAIRTRRSIRKFTNRKVEDKLLYTVLNAGFCAPSAKDKRPWHFIVIRDKDILHKLSDNKTDVKMLPEADLCIAVCGDKVLEGMEGYLLEDCAASIQNILLAAHGLGLGAVWCGLYPNAECSKNTIAVLELPQKVMPVALIAIGYPDEQKEAENRFDKSRIHFDKW